MSPLGVISDQPVEEAIVDSPVEHGGSFSVISLSSASPANSEINGPVIPPPPVNTPAKSCVDGNGSIQSASPQKSKLNIKFYIFQKYFLLKLPAWIICSAVSSLSIDGDGFGGRMRPKSLHKLINKKTNLCFIKALFSDRTVRRKTMKSRWSPLKSISRRITLAVGIRFKYPNVIIYNDISTYSHQFFVANGEANGLRLKN